MGWITLAVRNKCTTLAWNLFQDCSPLNRIVYPESGDAGFMPKDNSL